MLDKPAGVSSAAAVERVKRALRADRAGHGGTLDPIATGVLAVCVGEATKLAGYLLADDKAYEAEIVLGVETDTLDRTGAVTRERPWDHVTREAIERALAGRRGEQAQIPPMYSAIKRGGEALYKQARRGEVVEREPRQIRIDRLDLLDFAPPRARLAIACSKGTYVRSLVADLGEDLGAGAHLAELRRTRSGAFAIEDAQTLMAIEAAPDRAQLVAKERVVRLPAVVVVPDRVRSVLSGVQHAAELLGAPAGGEQFQLLDEAGTLLAIAHTQGGRIVYDRVFPA